MSLKKLMLFSGSSIIPPSPVGNLMTNDFSSGNWDSTKLTDGTVVFGGSSIQLNGATTGSQNNYIRYKQIYSASEKVKFSMTYTVGTVGGTNYGPGWSIIQNNPFQTTSIVNTIFYMSAPPDMGKTIYLGKNGGGQDTNGPEVGLGYTVTVGDIIKHDLTVNGNGYLIEVYQNGVLKNSQPFTLDYTYPGTGGINIAEWNICISNYGGSNTITAISIDSLEYKNIDLAIVGDSKSKGYWGGSEANTLAALWAANNPGKIVQLYAGMSATTGTLLNRVYEVIRAQPKNIILFIGRNDEAFINNPSITEPNYLSAVSQFQVGIPGVNIIHQIPIPENLSKAGTNNAPVVSAWIQATYSTKFMTVPATYNSVTDNEPTEGVHSISSGILKIYNNQTTYLTL